MSARSRILVIDDDREFMFGTRLRLNAAGYETLEAHDGLQAVASALTNRPAAILLDVRMPRLDGLAALGELKRRAETSAIPVIMVSASMRDQHAALDSGARFFLSKPYPYDDLLDALETALRETNLETEEPTQGAACHAQA